MIVDSHQHFVRLARHPEVEGFREAQLASSEHAGVSCDDVSLWPGQDRVVESELFYTPGNLRHLRV